MLEIVSLKNRSIIFSCPSHPTGEVIDHCKPVENDVVGKRRKRRSTSNVIIVPSTDEEPYIFDPPQVNIIANPTFPTKSGTTEQEAYNECNIAITQSAFGRACLEMYPDMNFTSMVDDCVLDIKVSGTLWISLRRLRTVSERKCRQKIDI